MRRALTWLGGAIGLAALARLRSRRRPATVGVPSDADPAEELRRKLADQRDVEPDPKAAEDAGDAAGADAAEPIDLEERRAEVHARAQEAIDRMRDGEPDSPPDGDSVA